MFNSFPRQFVFTVSMKVQQRIEQQTTEDQPEKSCESTGKAFKTEWQKKAKSAKRRFGCFVCCPTSSSDCSLRGISTLRHWGRPGESALMPVWWLKPRWKERCLMRGMNVITRTSAAVLPSVLRMRAVGELWTFPFVMLFVTTQV